MRGDWNGRKKEREKWKERKSKRKEKEKEKKRAKGQQTKRGQDQRRGAASEANPAESSLALLGWREREEREDAVKRGP